jgi:hypothetical protein
MYIHTQYLKSLSYLMSQGPGAICSISGEFTLGTLSTSDMSSDNDTYLQPHQESVSDIAIQIDVFCVRIVVIIRLTGAQVSSSLLVIA